MPVGVIVLGLFMLAIGGVHTAWQFFIAAVIGRAVSQPFLIGVVPQTMAVNLFNRHRNIALALTCIYRPISGSLIIQAFSAIAVLADWRAAFRYLGFFSLALAVPMIVIMRRRPEAIGLIPDGAAPNQPPTGAHSAGSGSAQTGRLGQQRAASGVSATAREALRTRAFWLIAVATILKVAATSGLGFSLVLPYLRKFAGITTPQAAGATEHQHFSGADQPGLGAGGGTNYTQVVHRGRAGPVCGDGHGLLWVDSLPGAYAFGVLRSLPHSGLEVLMYNLLADYFAVTPMEPLRGPCVTLKLVDWVWARLWDCSFTTLPETTLS